MDKDIIINALWDSLTKSSPFQYFVATYPNVHRSLQDPASSILLDDFRHSTPFSQTLVNQSTSNTPSPSVFDKDDANGSDSQQDDLGNDGSGSEYGRDNPDKKKRKKRGKGGKKSKKSKTDHVAGGAEPGGGPRRGQPDNRGCGGDGQPPPPPPPLPPLDNLVPLPPDWQPPGDGEPDNQPPDNNEPPPNRITPPPLPPPPPPPPSAPEANAPADNQFWLTSTSPAQVPKHVHQSVADTLGLLAYSAKGSLANPECQSWVTNFSLQMTTCLLPVSTPMDVESVLLRCEQAESRAIAVRFMSMLTSIQLATAVCSRQWEHKNEHNEHLSVEDIYNSMDATTRAKVSKHSFSKRQKTGQKYALLAAASSVFLLPIIIATSSKTKIDGLAENIVMAMGNYLRQPLSAPTDVCTMIINHLIPLITKLKEAVPLEFDTGFSAAYLSHRHVSATALTCGDLEQSDTMFGALKRHNITLIPRHPFSWTLFTTGKSLIGPTVTYEAVMACLLGQRRQLESSQGAIPDTECYHLFTPDIMRFPSPQCKVFDIPLDFASPLNKLAPYPAATKEDNTDRLKWDREQRQLASEAEKPDTLDEFITKLQESFDKRGVRIPTKPFLYMKQSFIRDQIIKLRALPSKSSNSLLSDSNLLAFINGSMPKYLRESLLARLRACFSSGDQDVLTSTCTGTPDQTPPKFKALHFSHYVRCGTKGHDAPKGTHPSYLRRRGCSRTNHHQFVPYASKEAVKNWDAYQKLCVILQEVFEWIADTMLAETPDLYTHLKLSVEILPGSTLPGADPWSCFVINFNAVTRVHRDGLDDSGCAVLIIGDFHGGELVFYEAGIVFDLKNGDLIIFPSWRITHFNLHYNGVRATLVCHSDKSGLGYREDFNGWVKSEFFF